MLKIKQAKKNAQLKTLAVDIGGTGVKMMVLDAKGKPLSDRFRVPTPEPAIPKSVLALLEEMKSQMPEFDRISVGFPGVVKSGRTLTAHNLSPEWVGFPLEQTIQRKWKRPTRLANDAAIQGFGAIRGEGVELVLTLGTGTRFIAIYRWTPLSRTGTGASSVARQHHVRRISGPRWVEETRETPLEQAYRKGCRANPFSVQLGYALPRGRQLTKDHIQIAEGRQIGFQRRWPAGRSRTLA